MNNMIDIHAHVIPKIDDGAQSFEEAYSMFLQASEAGFTDIIATSHYIEEYYEADFKKRNAWIEAMNKVLRENRVELQLHCGNEIYITQNLTKLIKEEKASTLARSKYVLFELPMNNNVKYLNEIIFEMKALEMIPVIAHPERYSYVQENPNLLINLIKQGALFQGNYASIIGRYGVHAKHTLKKLLKANMIHFLGTDSHRKDDTYTKMNEIMMKLEKVVSKEKIEALSKKNPQYILENKELKIEPPDKVRLGFFHS